MEDPMLALIAIFFEQLAMRAIAGQPSLRQIPAVLQLCSPKGQKQGITEDPGVTVATYFFALASKARDGDTQEAHAVLRKLAGITDPRANSLQVEALEKLCILDPAANPWYIDADANGKRVIVGQRYEWTPPNDDLGNEPGYQLTGVITFVVAWIAYAVWEQKGVGNPEYSGTRRAKPYAYGVFTDILRPVDG